MNDIKNHRFLNSINFEILCLKKINPPYRPLVRSPFDTSNFNATADLSPEAAEIDPNEDPFLKWN